MKWGLIVKPNDEKAYKLAREIHSFLKKNGEVFLDKETGKRFGIRKGVISTKRMNDTVDIVVTVGGDGTILFALESIDKPLFAINSSSLGFLTEVDAKFAKSALKRIVKGEYNIEERAKLKVILDGKRLQDATNEITIQTANIAKIIEFSISVDNETIENLRADGIIIATPTGATGYALSVGGPIVDPLVDAAVVAPIAPFKLSSRPWIVPYNKEICVELLSTSKEGKLVIDGRNSFTIKPNQRVCVTVSERKARFIRFGETFYQAVRLKLVR